MMDRAAFKETIKEALDNRAEELFEQVWGEPSRRGGHEWRPRATNARAMEMQGPKRGLWNDHTSGQGGDLLDLIAVEMCGLERAQQDFPRVLSEAAGWCGIDRNQVVDLGQLRERQQQRKIKHDAQERASAAQKAALVQGLVSAAQPIEGTIAAAYLNSREITALPSGLAYLPYVQAQEGIAGAGFASCVVWAVDSKGKVMGGQRILLNEDGTRPDSENSKPTFGKAGGYPARFAPRVQNGPLCIAEGPESALSIWMATGFETWAVFGVSNWQSAPVPTDREIILCPDQDAPEGTHPAGSDEARKKEAAARAFNRAAAHHAARGCHIRIARAPEPIGSKRDLNDTHQRAGLLAVREAIESAGQGPQPPQRAPNGRFTGDGLRPFTGTIENVTTPLPFAKARMKTAQDAQEALLVAAAWNGEGDAPVIALKSDPGLGKSHAMRELLARTETLEGLAGDVHFYSPTLALSDEAASHADRLGLPHAVTRGRLAKNPATGEPMCARPEDVDRVGRLGQPIKPTMCITQDDQGFERKCPFYESCAHRRQFLDIPAGKAVRFEALNYLTLKDAAEGREIGLRVIDETFWKAMGREATITLDSLLAPRSIGKCDEGTARDARASIVADLMECVSRIAASLRRGEGIMQAIADYSEDDLAEFAKAERWSEHRLSFFPDADSQTIEANLKAGEAHNIQAGAKAQFWVNIREAKTAGVSDLQNLHFIPGYKPKKTSDPRDVVKVYWHILPPRDVPVILLDADADTALIEPFYPAPEVRQVQVLPNADITYIVDKTFSKTSLLRKSARDEWRKVIAVERTKDAGGGTLVVATKKVVAAFFTDAGHDLAAMTDEDANAYMMNSRLHGVQWAWFGPATLGSNGWKDCTTVIVIGREEWPVSALEAEGRKIWGHGLELVRPDPEGRVFLPSVETPFPMADGSMYCVDVWAHPDPRIRAIQYQTRECATRQSVERLRLASAATRKRVIIGSKVPIPGLPASHVKTWAEYMPSREEAALAEAEGALRISGKGLAADAPLTFETEKAAQRYTEKNDLVESLFAPLTLNNTLINGGGVKNRVLVAFRVKGKRGSRKTRAVLVCHPSEAEHYAQMKWGDLIEFEILRSLIPEPDARAAASQQDEDARAERIAIIQEGEGVSYAEAVRLIDRLPLNAPVSPVPAHRRLDAQTPLQVRAVP